MSEQELEMEITLLRTELLAREMICAALVNKLGGKVTLTKDDMKDLMFIVGPVEHVIEANKGYALSRKKEGNSSVTYELIPKPMGKDEKVM